MRARDQAPLSICCVITTLTAGGAERVLANLANHWGRCGHQVTIILYEPPGARSFYRLEESVRLAHIDALKTRDNAQHVLLLNARRVVRIVRILAARRPDIVVSFTTTVNIVSVIACRLAGVPIVVTEHVDPARSDIGWLRHLFTRLTYPLANLVVVPNPRMVEHFSAVSRNKCICIHNPVELPKGSSAARKPAGAAGGRIATMGRLTAQKGFDLLIEAFSKIAGQFPGWTVTIWGDGELKEQLQHMIDALGLGDRIVLAGLTDDPYGELAHSDLFVLSSHFEGFGMVLVEAMATGLPVISFDCESGPREIISHGEDGLLVETGDVAALAAAMARLMGDPEERLRLGRNAARNARRFAIEGIAGAWDKALDAVIA